MNYSQLYTAITDYIEAGDQSFLDNIPNFVKAAEQKIYHMVQLPALRKNVMGNVTLGTRYLTLPADWLSAYSLAVVDAQGVYTFLMNKDVNYIREAFPDPSEDGLPTHYAIFDEDSLLLAPTPDANYEVELHYFHYPPSIVDAGTSWVGENFDTVLLYGSLVEANMYIKGEADMTTLYKGKFDDAMMELKKLADGRNRRDTYRSGQIRVPVV
jgi:hypothetical protein